MSIYFEASSLWTMYYEEEGGATVEKLLQDFGGYSLEWTLLELARAVAKRTNIGEITKKEAISLEAFIVSDLEKLSREGKLKLVKLTWSLTKDAYQIIRPLNLYASDASHIVASERVKAKVMLVDDYHFERLSRKISFPKIMPVTESYERVVSALRA